MHEITLALLTLPQAAQLTGLAVSTLRRDVLDGKLPALNVGAGRERRHYRVARADLSEYISKLKGPADGS